MDITIRVDIRGVETNLKQARRDLRKTAQKGLIEAGEKAILPRVAEEAPGVVQRDWLTVRATGARAYVTIQGPRIRDRIAGLLQYGGTVETPIRPKKEGGKLSFIGTKSFAGQRLVKGAVTGPRSYRGSYIGYIDRGIEKGLPEWERLQLPAVMDAFDGLEHTP